MRSSLIGALCALAVTAVAGPVLAQDLYIGTVDIQKDQVILTRCDLPPTATSCATARARPKSR